jgi:WD40 repeat protein
VRAERSSATVPVEDILSTLDAQPSVRDMVRNPFVLRLFVKVYPVLREASCKIDRYAIFNNFSRHWFRREMGRMRCCERALLLSSCDLAARDTVLPHLELVSALLAGAMLQQAVLEFDVVDNLKWWSAVKRAALKWVRESQTDVRQKDRLRAEWGAQTTEQRWQVCEDFGIPVDDDPEEYIAAVWESELRMMRQCLGYRNLCPVREGASYVQFVHTTYFEYFSARLILLAAGDDVSLELRVKRTAEVLSLNGRRIQDVPEVLYFLTDYWQTCDVRDPGFLRVRECLIAVVQSSRLLTPESTAARDSCGFAANAATILNWVGEPMCGLSWEGTVLVGADLTRAVLCSTSLVGATVHECRFEQSVLCEADMTGAALTGSTFGFVAPLACNGAVVAVACSGGSVFALTIGALQRWSGFVLAHSVVTSHFVCVDSCSPDDDHAWLAGVQHDGRVVVWNMTSMQALDSPGLDWAGEEVTCLCVGGQGGAHGVVVACGSVSGAVRLWYQSTEQSKVLPPAPDPAPICCLSMDETSGLECSHLVYATDGRSVFACNCDDDVPRKLATYGAAVTSLATSVSPVKGTRLVAVALATGRIHVVNVETGSSVCDLVGHVASVSALRFGSLSASGDWLLGSGGVDGSVRIWDVDSGALYCEVKRGHTGTVSTIAFGSVGGLTESRVVVSGGLDGTVRLWNRGRSKSEIVIGHSDCATCVSLCPRRDASVMLVSGGDDRGSHVVELNPHSSSLLSPRFSAAGVTHSGASCVAVHHPLGAENSSVAAFGCFDGLIVVREVKGSMLGREVLLSGHGGEVTSLVFCERGSDVDTDAVPHGASVVTIASCGHDRSLRLWRVSGVEGVPVAVFPLSSRKGVLSFRGPSQELLWVGDDGSVSRWSWAREWVATGSSRWTLGRRTHCHALCAAQFEDHALVACREGIRGPVVVHDEASQQQLCSVQGLSSVSCTALSQLGHAPVFLACGCVDGQLHVWKLGPKGTPPLEIVCRKRAHVGAVTCVTFGGSDNLLVATSGQDRRVRLWRVLEGASLGESCSLVWSSRSEGQGLEACGLLLSADLEQKQRHLLALAGCEAPAVGASQGPLVASKHILPHARKHALVITSVSQAVGRIQFALSCTQSMQVALGACGYRVVSSRDRSSGGVSAAVSDFVELLLVAAAESHGEQQEVVVFVAGVISPAGQQWQLYSGDAQSTRSSEAPDPQLSLSSLLTRIGLCMRRGALVVALDCDLPREFEVPPL